MPSEKDAKHWQPVILIVDDEQHCIDTLRAMMKRIYPHWTAIESCNSVASAREYILRAAPDLVFLDVEMPYQNGFTLLQSLPQVNFGVIFTTAYEHYAIKAIKFNALDYLLKPFSLQDLEKAVQKFLAGGQPAAARSNPAVNTFLSNLRQTAASPRKMAMPTLQGLIFIPLEDIVRCEAKDNYAKVYLTDGTSHLVSRTLKEFEYLLEDMNFFRVHYSHLINLQHMNRYIQGNGGYVIMSDGSSIEVSRRRKTGFLKKAAVL